MSLGSSRNHLSYFPYYYLIYNLIHLTAFKGQSVLGDKDPPYTVLIRVLVSRYKREVFVIKIERLPAASITSLSPRL